MRTAGRVSEAELHAFVDGQLSDDRAMAIAVWLADHPTEGARVDGWRAQNEAIQRAFPLPARERLAVAFRAPEADRPEPEAAPPTIDVYRSNRRRQRALATAIAFAAGAATASALAVFWHGLGSHKAPPDAFAEFALPANDLAIRAAAAWRTFALDANHPVEVSGHDRIRLERWLGERTGMTRAPDIAGARLLGGRVLPGRAANSAFLLYETSDGEKLALMAERADDAVPQSAMRPDGEVRVAAWRAGAFDYALAGRIAPDLLRAMANDLAVSANR